MGRSHAVKTIALLSVAALLLVELSGAMPRSSVGGPLTIMLIMLIAMLAVGIHDAWTKKRGPLGWIASIIASVIGGFVAASLVGMVMDMIRPHLHLNGSLVSSQHPLLYISLAGMAILTVLGSWITLQIPGWLVKRSEAPRSGA
jgi:uncharacterized membrane protein YeaQ/YmgE (transglycosylase-associated protein family)